MNSKKEIKQGILTALPQLLNTAAEATPRYPTLSAQDGHNAGTNSMSARSSAMVTMSVFSMISLSRVIAMFASCIRRIV